MHLFITHADRPLSSHQKHTHPVKVIANVVVEAIICAAQVVDPGAEVGNPGIVV